MQLSLKFRIGLLFNLFWILGSVLPAGAGVSHSIQEQYKEEYENKALFLRIPIYTEEQIIYIEGQTYRVAPGVESPLYKVGDQLRILRIDFGGNEIKFHLGAIASQGEAEIIYRFDTDLQESFPNRDVFDRALKATFTEGLKSSDIEEAKKTYLENEFNRSVGRMAGAASLSNEFVLKTIAPLIPDYRKTQLERDSLRNKVDEVSAELTQLQAEKRKLESDLGAQKSQLSRLDSTNASQQEKIKSYESEVLQLDQELQDANNKIQRFEREIAAIQNSLSSEADANRDLTRNNEELADRIRGLQEDLVNLKATNERMSGEIEDKDKQIQKLNGTIRTLTSNKDSLGRQYVQLKDEKEKLDDFAQTIDALRARMVEEKTSGGRYYGKADILLENVRLGSLEWNIPSYLSHNAAGTGEATFYAESIDYVKVTPEERHILKTLGEKLKIVMDLTSLAPTMKTSSDKGEEPRELGERESVTWNWQIVNNGTQDAPFLITASLINSHSRKISLFSKEYTVTTSNPIQRIRSYLQPIPLAVGVVLGFLLFGIVGIFRRPKTRKTPPTKPVPKGPEEPKTHVTEKKL
jgi:predicted  nucleic acid-binding Zn-ribbon protein